MKLKILPFMMMVFLASCSKKRVPNGTYQAFFYETLWTLEIDDNRFRYVSSGHLGAEKPINGLYKISGDTLILLTDSLGYHNKFLIDGDSCLIDVEMRTDYCNNRPEAEWGSRWRNINYPQIKVANPSSSDLVHWMLETTLNEREILTYFPDSTKSIVVQEYFELNKNADLNISSHGTKITFLSEQEIKEKRIEEYLIITEVHLGVKSGAVQFQVMPEFSRSILEFFEKVDGEWIHLKR